MEKKRKTKMKVKSILYDVISGSIGSITGAMGLGGAYFKEKSNPTNPSTALQKIIRDAMIAANNAWLGLSVAIKDEWNEYGKTLSYTNSTGHIVKQNGWTAFNASYILMVQGGMAITQIVLAPPTTSGYLTSPVIETELNAGVWNVANKSGIEMQMSVFVSPKERNTINTNTKGYQFEDNANLVADALIPLNATIEDGRFFIRARRIELNGAMSQESLIKVDLAAL